MPGLENRGGRLKSLLRAQLSLHTQATNLSRTDHRQKLTKWGKDPRHVRATIPIEAHHICTCIKKKKKKLKNRKIDLWVKNIQKCKGRKNIYVIKSGNRKIEMV